MADTKTLNQTFFDALLDAKAAKWSAGVAFDRSNPLPLDQWSVFKDLAAATDYLSNAKAYPGQVIAYAEENGEMTVCVLSQNAEGTALTLKAVGTVPVGDEKTIEVSATGAIGLLGAAGAANGTLPMIGEDGKLIWKTLEDIGAGDGNDNTTYEFAFADQKITITPKFNGQPVIDGEGENAVQVVYELDLSSFVTADELEAVVGKAAEGETAATGLYKAIADGVQAAKDYADANDANTTYTITYGDNDDASKKVIRLVDDANNVISEIDASDFIADGVLQDVEYNANTSELTFTWNVVTGVDEEGNSIYKTDVVNIGDLVDTYAAGNGLNLESNTFSVKVAEGSESFLSVDANGLKLAGVQDAIDTAKQAAIDDAAGKYATTGALSQLETDLDARLDVLEAIDHTQYATNEALQEVATTANNASAKVETLEDKIDEITSVGGEPNVIEYIQVNGATQTVTDKTVNITVPTKFSDLTDDSGFDARINAAQTKANEAAIAASNAQATADANAKVIEANDAAIKLLQEQDATHTSQIAALQQHDSDHGALYDALNATVAQQGTDIAGLKTSKADTSALNDAVARITANETAITTLNETTIPAINTEVGKKANAADVYTKSEVNAITGTVEEGKTLVDMINAAKSDATYDDTQVKADIKANADAITALTNGAVKDNADAINALTEQVGNVSNIMNFVGAKDTIPTDNTNYESGDVIIVGNQEYVFDGSSWQAFGDASVNGALISALDTRLNAAEASILAINNTDSGILAQAKKYTDDSIAALPIATSALAGLVKFDDSTIKMNESDQLYVAQVSTDLLVQGAQELHLCGGSASI